MPKHVHPAILICRDPTAAIDAVRSMDQILLRFESCAVFVESTEKHRASAQGGVPQFGGTIPDNKHVAVPAGRDSGTANVANRNRCTRNGIDSDGRRKILSVVGTRIEQISL